MKKIIITFILLVVKTLSQQEVQIPFHAETNLYEISTGSPFDSIGKSFQEDFEKLTLFKRDTEIILEINYSAEGRKQRKFQKLSSEEYSNLIGAISVITSQQKKFGEKENIADLRWDFVVEQTALAQYHSFAWTLGLDIYAPIGLLASGGSYFVVDYISTKLELSRFNVQNMWHSHSMGIAHGYLIGSMLSDVESLNKTKTVTSQIWNYEKQQVEESTFEEVVWPPSWLRIALLLSSGMGMYYTYDAYNESKIETNPGLFTLKNNLEAHSLTFLPLVAMTVLPDDFFKNNPIVEKATFWNTLALAPSLTAKYWVPKYFSDYKLTFGEAMMTDLVMTNITATGILSFFITQPNSGRVITTTVLASQIYGLYQGLNFAEGKNFQYRDVRHVTTFTYAGALTGFGLWIVLIFNESGDGDTAIKLLGALTIAGSWGGFYYGINSIEKNRAENILPENFEIKFNPEMLVASSAINKTSKIPIHLPAISLSYSW